MLIEKKDAWLLSPRQVIEARSGAKFWRTRSQIGKRSVICRECAGQIEKGPRLGFKHVDIKSRTYDLIGFLHTDLAKCAASKLEAEYMQFQADCVEDYLADPTAYESYF
jgi:hypothetical protein